MRTLALAALLLAALAGPARAFQQQTATTGAEFLRLGAGARSLGMGDAATAVADGPEAAYWNPAGLGTLSRVEAGYSRSELPAGVHYDFAAVVVPIPGLGGAAAASLLRMSQDSIALVDATNQTMGSFTPHSEAYQFSYGRSFGDNGPVARARDYFRDDWNVPRSDRPFVDDNEPWTGDIAVGGTVKGISENLGTRQASSFAIDFGALFRPSDLHELVLGAAVRDVGEKIRFIAEAEPLPVETSLAAAYEARADEWRLLPTVEAAFPYAGQVYGKLGFEASHAVGDGASAAVRVGFNSRSVPDLGPIAGITGGVGLKVGSFSFDAAFQPMAALGQNFRLGAGWKF